MNWLQQILATTNAKRFSADQLKKATSSPKKLKKHVEKSGFIDRKACKEMRAFKKQSPDIYFEEGMDEKLSVTAWTVGIDKGSFRYHLDRSSAIWEMSPGILQAFLSRVFSYHMLLELFTDRYPTISGKLVFELDERDSDKNLPVLTSMSRNPERELIPPTAFLLTGRLGLMDEVISSAERSLPSITGHLPWEDRAREVFWRGLFDLDASDQETSGDWRLTQKGRLFLKSKEIPTIPFNIAFYESGLKNERLLQELREAGLIEDSGDSTFSSGLGQEVRHRYCVFFEDDIASFQLQLSPIAWGAALLKVASLNKTYRWFYDRLEPEKHYEPVRADLSNLESACRRLLEDESYARSLVSEVQSVHQNFSFQDEIERALGVIERSVIN